MMNETKTERETHTVTITWVQRGHNTHDPTGQNQYRQRATWAIVNTVEEAAKELHRAERYCRERDWTDWEVSRD
jgi:hypothetical protein